MKKAILLISVSLLIISCASVKNTENPIHFYLQSKLTDTTRILVIQEKINNSKTIDIFNGNPYVNSKTGEIIRYDGAHEPFYNDEAFTELAKKYSYRKTDTIWTDRLWEERDFNNHNVAFIKKKEYPMVDYFRTGKNPELKVYSFSDVIKYDRDYYIFTVANGTTHGTYLLFWNVIVMEKKEGKWNTVQEIGNYM